LRASCSRPPVADSEGDVADSGVVLGAAHADQRLPAEIQLDVTRNAHPQIGFGFEDLLGGETGPALARERQP